MNSLRATLLVVAGVLAAAEPLTLAEALRLAGERHETAEVAAARLDRAAANRRRALAALLPSLGASASMQRSSVDYRPFGGAVAANASDGLTASIALFDPAAWLSRQAVRADAAADELEAGELRRTLAFSTASAFLQAWAADRQLAAAERRRAVALRTVEEGRARVVAGVATAASQARNELELASADLALTSARLAVTTTRLALADLIVAPAPASLADPPSGEAPEGGAVELASAACERRADLRAAALRVEAYGESARSQRAGYLPNLSLTGGVGVSEVTREVLASGEPIWTAALTARWTLYDGGAGLASAAVADAQRREAAANLRAATRGLSTDLDSARATLDAAAVGTAQAEKQVEVARINLTEVEARAGQGLATGLQTADASASLYEAEKALTAARLAQESARYRLRQLVGWWPLSAVTPAAPAPPR